MARSFDAATLALLDGDRIVQRDMLVISMPEGSFGFWSDVYSAQFPGYWPGVTFTGSGSLVEISEAIQTVSDEVQTMSATLSGLDGDVLQSIGAYNLHRATVEIACAQYDPDTRALVAIVPIFRGYFDRDEIRETGDDAVLVGEFVSRSRELDRSTNRTRTHADQQRTFPGDRGFEFTVKTATTQILVGQ